MKKSKGKKSKASASDDDELQSAGKKRSSLIEVAQAPPQQVQQFQRQQRQQQLQQQQLLQQPQEQQQQQRSEEQQVLANLRKPRRSEEAEYPSRSKQTVIRSKGSRAAPVANRAEPLLDFDFDEAFLNDEANALSDQDDQLADLVDEMQDTQNKSIGFDSLIKASPYVGSIGAPPNIPTKGGMKKKKASKDYPTPQIDQQSVVQKRMVHSQLKQRFQYKSVVIHAKKWLEGGYETDCYPLDKIDEVIGRNLSTPNDQLVEINLYGLDDITDMFMHHLLSKFAAQLKQVGDVILNGCLNVTDRGVHWLSKACPNLKKVTLVSCRGVTSRGLSHLSRNCPALRTVDVTGTGVNLVPKHVIRLPSFTAEGCYIMNTTRDTSLNNIFTYRLLIVRDDVTTGAYDVSLADYLLGAPPSGARVKYAELKVEGWKGPSAGTYHIVEGTSDICSLFAVSRCLYLLPYDTSSINVDGLMERLLSIIARADGECYIVMVGLGNGTQEAATLVKPKINALRTSLEDLIDKYKKSQKDLDFYAQTNLARAYSLLYSLESLATGQFDGLALNDIRVDTTKVEKDKSLSPDMVKQFELFEDWCVRQYPECVQMNNHFIMAMNKLEKKQGLMRADDVIDAMMSSKVMNKRDDNRAALEVMHQLGKVVYLPGLPGKPCVTDQAWLLGLVASLAAPPTASGQLTNHSLGDAKYWTEDGLQTAFKHEKKISEIVDFLAETGLLCQRRVVVLFNQLSKDPPPALTPHLPDPKSDCYVTWSAETGHVIPSDVICSLIGRCLKLRPPVVLWRRGLVVREGGLDVVIRRAESGTAIELMVITASPSSLLIKTDPVKRTVTELIRGVVEQYALITLATIKLHEMFATTTLVESGISLSNDTASASSSKRIAPPAPSIEPTRALTGHHVIVTDRAGYSRHVCEWCGLEGKNIHMLADLGTVLRPSRYKHQTLRALNGTDESGSLARTAHITCMVTMKAEQEGGLKTLTCLEPYSNSHYSLVAGQYFDTAVGVQSFCTVGDTCRLFLSRDKLLLGTGAHAQFKELQTIKRDDAPKQGDVVTVRVTLARPDYYRVHFEKNGLTLCSGEVPAGDYVPFLAPAVHFNTSKAIRENQQTELKPAPRRTEAVKLNLLQEEEQEEVPIPEKDSVSNFTLDLSSAPTIQEPAVLSTLDVHFSSMAGHAVEIYIPHSNANPLNPDDPKPDSLPAEYAVGTIEKTEPSRLSNSVKFSIRLGDGTLLDNVPLNRLFPPGYREQVRKRLMMQKIEEGNVAGNRLSQDEVYQNMINMNPELTAVIPAEVRNDDMTPIVRKPYTENYITTVTVDVGEREEEMQVFDWRRYLADKQLKPVLLDMFAKAKHVDLEWFRPLAGFSSKYAKQCRFQNDRPIALEWSLSRLVTTMTRRYLSSRQPFFLRDIMIALLPPMTSQSLATPTRRHVQQTGPEFHLLCPQTDSSHFLNVPGVKIKPDVLKAGGEALKFLMCMGMYTGLQLLDQPAVLPLTTDKLVAMGTEKLDNQQLEEGVRELIYLTLMSFSLYVNDNDVINTLAKKGKDSKLPLDSMKALMEACTLVDDTAMKSFVSVGIMRESGSRSTSCPAHTSKSQAGLNAIPIQMYTDFTPLLTSLDFSGNSIKSLPPEIVNFVNLQALNMKNNMLAEIPSLSKLVNLTKLYLSHNNLTTLPDMRGCVKLETVNLSTNPLMSFPKTLLELESLSFLNIGNTGMTSLPDNFGKLTSLTTLICRGLTLNALPDSFTKLTCLTTLDLSGLAWISGKDKNSIMTLQEYHDFFEFNENVLLQKLSEEERLSILGPETSRKATLTYDDIQSVNATIFKRFRRFCGKAFTLSTNLRQLINNQDKLADQELPGGFPEQLAQLTQLEYLNLSYQGLLIVPCSVANLKNLKNLILTDNPQLEVISSELGDLPLESLLLQHCPVLKTPPKEIVSKGFKVVYGYLKRLKMGSVSCKRTKLMMVGLGGAGKTSLVKALTVGSLQKAVSQGESITDGIDITTWEKSDPKVQDTVTFSVWDFAGQTVYYNTHQFFLSNRAIYLLLWNVRLGYEHAGLDFWCSSIACHAPKASILIVGSHCDKVENPELPIELMQKRYPQIKGFHFISCYDGKGIEKLSSDLLTIALNEKYMGESIPEAWLKFEAKVLSQRSKSLLSWEEVKNEAVQCGIIEDDDIQSAVRFLHDLGSLQHFNNERLKSRVVVDPQWIVDVMACVVSVHDNAIKDGVFHHSAMSTVWRQYPKDLYPWLLELTEEFDLTFRLKGKEINLVPCLLPSTEPKRRQVTWPDVYSKPGCRENKIRYTFEYLPAGLFNRAQVRLCQFSDESMIYRMGSFLKKNNHIALVQQTRDNELLVKVQGPRPENMLFFIHEVFESLIRESFHGVKYDYFIPCPDCLNAGLEPCMFSAAKIRRAIQFRAPFLQCDTSFHSVTMSEMKALKPPEGEADYDAHLKKTSRDLKGLQDVMSRDIFIYYCEADCPKSEKEKYAHPKRLLADLTNLGYKVLLPDKPSELELERETVTLKASELILFCMSNNFVKNARCMEFFYYVVKILRRRYVILCIGDNHDWRNTNIGFHVATDVYINMVRGKKYDDQLLTLKDSLLKRISNKSRVYPPCFVSYCWRNSREAGMGSEEGYGWEDPRKIKRYMEENGVQCWMDTDRVMGRLFEDIAEGLRHAKLMIACVSDEYVQSENCSLEFNFAATTLKIPIVVAVVGKGSKWQESGIGLRCVTRSQVDFRQENSLAHPTLLTRVQEQLPREGGFPGDGQPIEDAENCKISYTELFELGKRKFLRQVAHIASGMSNPVPYPRLIVIDILPIAIPKAPSELADDETPPEVFVNPVTKAYKMGYKLLCEHDEQWHVVEPVIEMKTMDRDEQIKLVESVAGYMARLITLLDNSTLDLNILNTECGNELTKIILDKCREESPPTFGEEYEKLREACITDDTAKTRPLHRCQQSSRKLLWLCKEHQQSTESVVIEDNLITEVQEDEESDAAMAEQILQARAALHDDDKNKSESVSVKSRNKEQLVQRNLAAHSSGPDRVSSAICCVQ